MNLLGLWWLWFILAVSLICYAVRSARRHGEQVLQQIENGGIVERTDYLPFWRVKMTFFAGTVFSITFFLSVTGWVLSYVARIADIAAAYCNSVIG
ncbi:MAG: hypothetical protein V1738_06720 [Patescibacteria group bacterium]